MAPIERAVVVVDLSRYSDAARELDQHFGPDAVRQLNQQIQNLVKEALATAGVEIEELPYKPTGDGAILALENAELAHRFAEALHLAARERNRGKDVPLAQRHFRAGIWTEELILERQSTAGGEFIGFEFAGMAVSNAVRLEGACRTGEVLISADTWGDLPRAMRKLYGHEEVVKGKRNEEFHVHRRKVVEPAPWDVPGRETGAGETDKQRETTKEEETEAAKPAARGMAARDRLGLIRQLSSLSPPLFESVVFALDPPGGVVPHGTASQGERAFALLSWVEGPGGRGLLRLQEVLEKVLNP